MAVAFQLGLGLVRLYSGLLVEGTERYDGHRNPLVRQFCRNCACHIFLEISLHRRFAKYHQK